MISEILFLIQSLGLKKNLENLRAMKDSRSPIRGYVLTRCFWALMEIGLIDELEKKGSVKLDLFCQSHPIDRVILDMISRTLIRMGYLECDNGALRFSRKGRQFWKEVNGVFNIFAAYEPFFENLSGLLKKEISLAELKRRDEWVARGFRETGKRFTFPIMAKIVQAQNAEGVIELGCGNIDLSLYLARRAPRMRFLGIDYDDRFLAEARETLRENNLSSRIQLLKKDIFDLSAADYDFSPYNLVTAIDLFHGYFFDGKEKLLALLMTLRKTFPGKKFLVSEVLLPDENRMRRLAYPHVEHELFHNLTGQKTFQAGELEALLKEAGFTVTKVWSVRNLAARSFIECKI